MRSRFTRNCTWHTLSTQIFIAGFTVYSHTKWPHILFTMRINYVTCARQSCKTRPTFKTTKPKNKKLSPLTWQREPFPYVNEVGFAYLCSNHIFIVCCFLPSHLRGEPFSWELVFSIFKTICSLRPVN